MLLFIIGLLGGLIGSIVGLGGGIIIVPSLLFFGNETRFIEAISLQQAVGTSMLLLIVTGLSSTIAYTRQERVHYKTGLWLFAGSGPGAIFGAWLNHLVSLESFSIVFGLFIVALSFLLYFRKKWEGKEMFQKELSLIVKVSLAFFVGVLSGLFGIGGGSLFVPLMILVLGFTPSKAVGTSMFIVFLSAVLGSLSHLMLGHIHWLYALFLVPGAWLGAKLGALLNRKLKDDTVVLLLRTLLLVIGLRFIWNGLSLS